MQVAKAMQKFKPATRVWVKERVFISVVAENDVLKRRLESVKDERDRLMSLLQQALSQMSTDPNSQDVITQIRSEL